MIFVIWVNGPGKGDVERYETIVEAEEGLKSKISVYDRSEEDCRIIEGKELEVEAFSEVKVKITG